MGVFNSEDHAEAPGGGGGVGRCEWMPVKGLRIWEKEKVCEEAEGRGAKLE